MSTDEDTDTDYSVDYECDDVAPLLSRDDGYVKPASSEHQNGICSENRSVDGLANNVKGSG